MPRKPRLDIEPTLWLREDLQEKQVLANDAVNDQSLRTIVYEPGLYEEYTVIYNELFARLDDINRRRTDLNEGLLFKMLMMCEMANIYPVKTKSGNQVRKEGCLGYKLRAVGCRVHINAAMAKELFGMDEDTFYRQTKIMREEGLIVNWRTGYGPKKAYSWYEFDCSIVWRGKSALRQAYQKVQRIRGEMVITDGEETTITTGLPDVEEGVKDGRTR